MGKKSKPIHLVVHYPETDEGKQILKERAARAHAEMVEQYIGKLNCPKEQKEKLLDQILEKESFS